VDWIDLSQDRDKWRAFVNEAMSVLENAGKVLSGFATGGPSNSAQLDRVI
jgi:hypothetical protein